MPKLSDSLVASLVCPPGKKDALFFDGEVAGFGVRVTDKGRRVFLFQYRTPVGVRRMVLGAFGELTTKQARVKAQIRLGEVRDGRDPDAERRANRINTLAQEAEAKRAAAEATFTLRRLIDDWETRHLVGLRPSYRLDAVGRLRLHLGDLLELPAAEVTKAQIVRKLDHIGKAAGETTARRVMAYARAAYNWTRKRDAIATNPFEGLPPIGREVRRDRVLTLEEVGSIWQAALTLPPVHGAFVRFLLLTLQRREEVASMQWHEVAPDLSSWTLPAGRAKNGRAHTVYLTAAAQQILQVLPRFDADGLVFAIGPGKSLTTFSWIVRRLMIESDTSGWRLHDFRRTGVTMLAEWGFAPHVCDRLLNHVSGAIQGVAAVYQRAEFMTERQAALEAWSTSCCGATNH